MAAVSLGLFSILAVHSPSLSFEAHLCDQASTSVWSLQHVEPVSLRLVALLPFSAFALADLSRLSSIVLRPLAA